MTIDVEIDGEIYAGEPQNSVLSLAQKAGVQVPTACGGRGNCHLCRVLVLSDRAALTPPTAIEKKALGNVLIAAGMRLSCQFNAVTGLKIALPKRRR